MEQVLAALSFVLSDVVVFTGFQIGLFVCCFVAWVKERRAKKASKYSSVAYKLTRGNKGMEIVYYAFGAVLTFLITQLVNAAEVYHGYKTAIYLFDFSLVVHLFLLNGWFRNKMIGFFSKLKEVENYGLS